MKRFHTVVQVVSYQPEDVVPINVGREVVSESVQVETTLYVVDAKDFSAVLNIRNEGEILHAICANNNKADVTSPNTKTTTRLCVAFPIAVCFCVEKILLSEINI